MSHSLKKQNNAPKNAPAWKTEVMLLETALLLDLVIWKSARKLSRAMVVPTKAES